MIQFLDHEVADSVAVATVDIKAGENAKGLFRDSQKGIEIASPDDIPLGHKITLTDHAEGVNVIMYESA